jgi:hypothetical protein
MAKGPEGESRPKRLLRGVRSGLKGEGDAYRYVGAGLTFALSALLFLGIGYKLDSVLGTLPLFTLIGAFAGGAGGFIYLIRSLSSSNSDRKPPQT